MLRLRCQEVFIVSNEEMKTIFAVNVPLGYHMKLLGEKERKKKCSSTVVSANIRSCIKMKIQHQFFLYHHLQVFEGFF